jgi:hypothetical protein
MFKCEPFIRKIEYLKSIGNEEEVRNYRATDKRLLDELDRDVGEASWKDWKQKVKNELFVSSYLCICFERERGRETETDI